MTNEVAPTDCFLVVGWEWNVRAKQVNNLTGKLFNHQKRLIYNFVTNWSLQFAVFQKRFAIREL